MAKKVIKPVENKHTITITLTGFGGEIWAGKVDRKSYDYFKEHRLDISEYSFSSETDVPEEFQPFEPGSPYDCDDIFHSYGVELSGIEGLIHVSDDEGNEWECSLDESELVEQGVNVEETPEDYYISLEPNEVAYFNQDTERGAFFDEEIEIVGSFDPSKLKLTYTDYEGWNIVQQVFYDGKEVEINNNGIDTIGKYSTHEWVLGEDVESYEPAEKPKAKKAKKK